MKKQTSVRIDETNVDFLTHLSLSQNITHPLSSTLPNISKTLNIVIDEYRTLYESKIALFKHE